MAEIDGARTAATARTIAKEKCTNTMCEDAIWDQIVLKIVGRRAALYAEILFFDILLGRCRCTNDKKLILRKLILVKRARFS